jgi:hypothetical protein
MRSRLTIGEFVPMTLLSARTLTRRLAIGP